MYLILQEDFCKVTQIYVVCIPWKISHKRKVQGSSRESYYNRKEDQKMIKYDPLWKTLKKKSISQYRLIKEYGVDKAQLQRLRKNLIVKTLILNKLCNILDCRIEDIMVYVPDQEDS